MKLNREFWFALLMVFATACLMAADYFDWVNFGFSVGPFRLNHWFVWIGTLYMALTVPIIAVLKRKRPSKYLSLLRLHVFGNLAAFLLVSLHFAGQIWRPAAFYPDLGTGIVLYIAMLLLVSTGFAKRFQLFPRIKYQNYRFVHTSSAMAFYLTITVHILHGLGIL
ncbi:MAG: hypothetical protein NWE94_02320 [Candidatus Bathyarchaeota archaeon]|nr:hypothetical protein [Candidatus Bathyarchaeota archaeon]